MFTLFSLCNLSFVSKYLCIINCNLSTGKKNKKNKWKQVDLGTVLQETRPVTWAEEAEIDERGKWFCILIDWLITWENPC